MLSTGPKTDAGKSRSRANALTHGLCADIVVPEDYDLVRNRTDQVFSALLPQNEFQAWLVDRIAIFSVRIERCERMERRTRDKISLRAELTWDDDRKLDAEILGANLAKRPAETVEALRQTPQGCDWLMTRWALLAHAAEHNADKKWTMEQTALAFDLLATPDMFRAWSKPGTVIDYQGNLMEPLVEPVDVARRMVAELEEHRAVVAELDQVERALTETDHDHESDPELRRLRRYEGVLYNRLRWAISQIKDGPVMRPYLGAMRGRYLESLGSSLKPDPKTEDELAAEKHDPTSVHPPFCLNEDEFPPPGEKANIPAILKSRKEKRAIKAQARRESNRRRVQNLRS